MEKNKLNN